MIHENDSLETVLSASFKESVPLAFLELLKNTVELTKNKISPFIDDYDLNLDEMIDYTKNIVNDLENILNEKTEKKLNRIKILLDNKEKLIEMYGIISSYLTELNTTALILEEKYQAIYFNDKNIESLDYNQFYNEFYLFISDYINEKDFNSVLHKLLENIPIRITKNKFYDYIEKSISQIEIGNSPTSIEQLFSRLKQQFIGTSAKGYGIFLPNIAKRIEDNKNKVLLELNENEIETLWEELESLEEPLSNIVNILFLLYNIFNSLSVLLMLENVNLQSLYRKHIAYKDFYLSTSSIINWTTNPEDKELYIETLPDLINKHIIILQENLKEIHSKIVNKINPSENGNDNFMNDELLVKTLENYELVLFYLNNQLNDSFNYYEKEKNKIEPSLHNKIKTDTKDFIEFLDIQLKSMDNIFRKARMQNFLGIIPIAMNKDELINYLVNAIDITSSVNKKAAILNKIGTIMDSYGFFDNEICDCKHEHHHH